MRTDTREMYNEIVDRYGNMVSLSQISHIIGRKSAKRLDAFLEGLPCYEINGRRRWRTADIARRIIQCEVKDD